MALDAILHKRESSWLRRFYQAPCPTLGKTIYSQRRELALRLYQEEPESADQVTVVCVSSTHNSQPRIPPGDILIHAGDLTQGGTAAELQTQLQWLNAQPHAHKLVIAGNHDTVLDPLKAADCGFSSQDRESLQWGSLVYLQHSSCSVEVRGWTLSVFGHPSTRKNGNWAFQYERGLDLFHNQIPEHTDILVTHSPPQFHLDIAGWGEGFLLKELERMRPKLHVFRHIHGGYGKDVLIYDTFECLYQEVSARRAGIVGVLHMAVLLLYMLATGLGRDVERTLLVNAAAVGGLGDESIRTVQTIRL